MSKITSKQTSYAQVPPPPAPRSCLFSSRWFLPPLCVLLGIKRDHNQDQIHVPPNPQNFQQAVKCPMVHKTWSTSGLPSNPHGFWWRMENRVPNLLWPLRVHCDALRPQQRARCFPALCQELAYRVPWRVLHCLPWSRPDIPWHINWTHSQYPHGLHHASSQWCPAETREMGISYQDNYISCFNYLTEWISMDPTTVKVVQEWNTRHFVKNVLAFLEFANYYRWFIQDFSLVAILLSQFTCKDLTFACTPEAQQDFGTLKTTFTTAPILIFTNTL